MSRWKSHMKCINNHDFLCGHYLSKYEFRLIASKHGKIASAEYGAIHQFRRRDEINV